jgi:hypothetical protein
MVLERLGQNKKAASGRGFYITVPEEYNSDVAANSLTIEIYRVMREQ